MDYEQLGAFYLGRRYDLERGEVTDEPILYDAKDLTTHAVCVGMTGSGKTGLGVALLEEAILDGIPVIAIDPKGDLGNLLLAFPELRAEDFRPWIDHGAAERAGRSVEEQSAWTAELWRKGLADWGQEPARIARFRDAAEAAIYTPGSTAGRPLSVLRSLAAPRKAVATSEDALRERTSTTVSSILALLGIDADPLRSREHILLSTILDGTWRNGNDLDLAGLIRAIQEPAFDRVGVLDLESFYPAKERFELAMTINNLVASPAFRPWMEGEPLDIASLLYSPDGKARLSILSIAHLSEAERMFFVTLVLSELIAWMRAQPGAAGLRALLYMDEVFGFFPPTANPPSKMPMLTLLKQARAYGLGVVLATQNPVDLDYKGLSNAGTWFLGRLQTERDKARVLEGLEGASVAAGSSFDRRRMDQTLAGLGARVFLMNNVHEDEPVLFHTRWVLSYLAGPMTRVQIRAASAARAGTAGRRPAVEATAAVEPAPSPAETPKLELQRPALPPDIPESFVVPGRFVDRTTAIVYRPALLAALTLHYKQAKSEVDAWRKLTLLAPLEADDAVSPWEASVVLDGSGPELADTPIEGAGFAPLPAAAARAKSYSHWEKMLKTHAYRSCPLELLRCADLRLVADPQESEGEFRGRLRELARERRDLAVEKLRKSYAPKLARLVERIRSAEERVERERAQYEGQKTQTAISIGSTVLGALFGRTLASSTTVGRATTAARGAGRAARERDDVRRAGDRLEELRERLAELEKDLEAELKAVRGEYDADRFTCDRLIVRPSKSEIAIERMCLAWTPYFVDEGGVMQPLTGLPARPAA